MKVVFTFDENAMVQNSCTRDGVYFTIKKLFAKNALPCVSDNEELSLEDNGHEDDYVHMWNILFNLLRSDWFVRVVSSCIWYDMDEEEDVLSQACKVRQMA